MKVFLSILLAGLLSVIPARAYADEVRSDRCVACPVEFPNVAPGQVWILNQTGNLYVAVNQSTGQSVLVTPSGFAPGFYTVGNGVTLIVPGPSGIVGAFVPIPGATPNLWSPGQRAPDGTPGPSQSAGQSAGPSASAPQHEFADSPRK